MAKISLFHNVEDFFDYKKGDTVFNEGDAGEFLYEIVEGEISLRRAGAELIRLQPGEIFGEVALINNDTHSVTAIASVDAKVAKISARRFFYMVDQTPQFALQVMRVLAERLKLETEKNL